MSSSEIRVEYDDSGRKIAETEIRDGQENGFSRIWHATGMLAPEAEMHNGEYYGKYRS